MKATDKTTSHLGGKA